MIQQAISDLGLDPARSAIIGDKKSDIEAGAAAGLGLRILVAAHPYGRCEKTAPHEVVADLDEALALLRSRFAAAAPDGRVRHP
jgi:D-glycero-D-manno-heptose 1,7-bisphosphate phosphatase